MSQWWWDTLLGMALAAGIVLLGIAVLWLPLATVVILLRMLP